VLDASFKIVRQSFGTLAGCVLVVALPLNIINTLIASSTRNNAFNLKDTTTTSDVSTGTQVAGLLLTTTLGLVLTTLAAAACFRAVSGAYLGERPTVGESLSFAAGRVLPVIVLSILYFVGVTFAILGLLVASLWLSVAWSVSFPALLSEGLGPVEALGRSFRLVKGRWWSTFGALLVMYLLVAVISGILGAILGAALVTSTDNEAVAAVFYTIVNTLSSLITLPLFAAVLTVLYFDLRVRKEGFDLQLLARGVGRETSAQSVGAASGLGGDQPQGGFAPPAPAPQSEGFSPPSAPSEGGGFAPPQAPPASTPPPGGAPPAPSGEGLQSGDPLGGDHPPTERREGDGGAGS
jgi:hypothetical protein